MTNREYFVAGRRGGKALLTRAALELENAKAVKADEAYMLVACGLWEQLLESTDPEQKAMLLKQFLVRVPALLVEIRRLHGALTILSSFSERE